MLKRLFQWLENMDRARWLKAQQLGFRRYLIQMGLLRLGMSYTVGLTAFIYALASLTRHRFMGATEFLGIVPLFWWCVLPLLGLACAACLWGYYWLMFGRTKATPPPSPAAGDNSKA